MPLPFWPKIASMSDAPNYRPTAGDARCETCTYFRALNDGGGYCERFAFQAEPQSVCDSFVEAGRTKMASWTRHVSAFDKRVRDFANNPITRRVAVSAGTGAVGGASAGAYGSGEDAASEAVRGAALGGAAGSLLGSVGPLSRLAKARSNFTKTVQSDTRFHQKAISDLQKSITDLTGQTNALKKTRDEMSSRVRDIVNKDLNKLQESVDNARYTYRTLRKTKGPEDPDTLLVKTQLQTRMSDLRAKQQEVTDLRSKLQELDKRRADLASSKDDAVTSLNDAKDKIEALKRTKFAPDYKDISKAKPVERYGVPALSSLVGAGLGFGVSHQSKEHEKFRSSKY